MKIINQYLEEGILDPLKKISALATTKIVKRQSDIYDKYQYTDSKVQTDTQSINSLENSKKIYKSMIGKHGWTKDAVDNEIEFRNQKIQNLVRSIKNNQILKDQYKKQLSTLDGVRKATYQSVFWGALIIGSTAIYMIGNYAYKRFLSKSARSCNHLNGEMKTSCIHKYKLKAALIVLAQLKKTKSEIDSVLNNSDPKAKAKAHNKIDKAITKAEAKIDKLKNKKK